MKVSGSLGMVVGPVRVELFRGDAFLSIVEEFDVKYTFEILSTCWLIGEGAAFGGGSWLRSRNCPRLWDTRCSRRQRKERQQET